MWDTHTFCFSKPALLSPLRYFSGAAGPGGRGATRASRRRAAPRDTRGEIKVGALARTVVEFALHKPRQRAHGTRTGNETPSRVQVVMHYERHVSGEQLQARRRRLYSSQLSRAVTRTVRRSAHACGEAADEREQLVEEHAHGRGAEAVVEDARGFVGDDGDGLSGPEGGGMAA